MTTPPVIHFTFCDDIREEIDSKYSLMGIYGDIVCFQQPTKKYNLHAVLYITLDEEYGGIFHFDLSGYLNDQQVFNQELGEVAFFDWEDNAKIETSTLVTYQLNTEIRDIPISDNATFQLKTLLALDNGKQFYYDSHKLTFKQKPFSEKTTTIKAKRPKSST